MRTNYAASHPTQISVALAAFNLKSAELAVYNTVLKLGTVTAGKIAKAAGVNRPYAYEVLSALIDKGLIVQSESRGVRHFSCASVPALVELLDRQLATLLRQRAQLLGFLPHLHQTQSRFRRDVVGGDIETSSVLEHVHQMKAVHLEHGREGHDQFFREVFDHENRIESIGTFDRFSLQSHPVELLNRSGVTEPRIMQAKAMHEGYRSGRCCFTEIHHVSRLWDCITKDEDGFILYPEKFDEQDVALHLEHMIYMLQTYPQYEVVLVKTPIPFNVVTAEIFEESAAGGYSVFLPRASKDSLFNISSFAVSDDMLCRNVLENVTYSLRDAPSAIRDRDEVIDQIYGVRSHLKQNGPIAAVH